MPWTWPARAPAPGRAAGRAGDLGGQRRDLQDLAGADDVRQWTLSRLAQYSTGQAFCLWYTLPAIEESESPDRMV